MCSVVEGVSSNVPVITSQLVDYTQDKIVGLARHAITGDYYVAMKYPRTGEFFPVALKESDRKECFMGFLRHSNSDLVVTDSADQAQVIFFEVMRGGTTVRIGSVERCILYARAGGPDSYYLLKSVEEQDRENQLLKIAGIE